MPASAIAYRDPCGQAAAANVDRRNRIAEHIARHPGDDVPTIARSLGLSRYVVTADVVHLVSIGRLKLAVIAKNA